MSDYEKEEAVLKELGEPPLTEDERSYLDAKAHLRLMRIAEHKAERVVREAHVKLKDASRIVGLAEDMVHEKDRKVYRDLEKMLEMMS